MATTFFTRWSSENGPLESERPILSRLLLPADDHAIGSLVVPGLEATRGLTPGGDRMAAARGATLAAAVRVIDRVHRDAAVVRLAAQMPGTPRLAERYVLVIEVAHLADRGLALYLHAPDFTRRELEERVLGFAGNQAGL